MHDIKFIAAIAAGTVMSLLLSTAETWKARLTCVASGVFFAVFFTGPFIDWAGFDLDIWRYSVAALLAMTGDRLARRIMMIADTAQPWKGDRQ